MRHNREIKNKLVANAEVLKQEYAEAVDDYVKDLSLARSVEGIMLAKKQFLLRFVADLIPIYSDSCYFCIMQKVKFAQDGGCDGCEYAKYHGYCLYESSDYAKLRRAKQRLTVIILNKYYKGERYRKEINVQRQG